MSLEKRLLGNRLVQTVVGWMLGSYARLVYNTARITIDPPQAFDTARAEGAAIFVFWHGMNSIRKFIGWAGPAVYVVMIALTVYMVVKAGMSNINFTLGTVKFTGLAALPTMLSAISLVVAYFSGPLLNFGDISRYGKSMEAVKKGNFWGLPVNFTFFSLLTVVCAAATVPVYGELITDPVQTVGRIDNTFAIILGALTFATATVGINIVANFISPAFDFSHVAPQKISWRMGGMIAAIGSVLITPWNLYSNPTMIHYTLDVLGAFTGALFGILVVDYYLVKKRRVDVDEAPEGQHLPLRPARPRRLGNEPAPRPRRADSALRA